MTASPRPSWLSPSTRRHLFLVLALLFPLGLQLTGFKLIKLFALEPHIGIGKVFAVLRVDWTLLLLGGWVALVGPCEMPENLIGNGRALVGVGALVAVLSVTTLWRSSTPL